MNGDPLRERLEFLYAMLAVGELSPEEAQELERLRPQYPDIDENSYQVAAAAMHLAIRFDDQQSQTDSIPEKLRDRVLKDARDFQAKQVRQQMDPAGVSHSQLQWLGWICALAATIALIIVSIPIDSQQNSASIPVESLRLALLERDDSKLLDWQQGSTPFKESVTGNVVWNQAEQQGYMLFEGMPINDPSIEQYQLWIIDPKRDQHPIDGGVFDVSDPNRAVVAIDAKLRVVDAQAFAITIEKPGGVVVSDQSRLPLIASTALP